MSTGFPLGQHVSEQPWRRLLHELLPIPGHPALYAAAFLTHSVAPVSEQLRRWPLHRGCCLTCDLPSFQPSFAVCMLLCVQGLECWAGTQSIKQFKSSSTLLRIVMHDVALQLCL